MGRRGVKNGDKKRGHALTRRKRYEMERTPAVLSHSNRFLGSARYRDREVGKRSPIPHCTRQECPCSRRVGRVETRADGTCRSSSELVGDVRCNGNRTHPI